MTADERDGLDPGDPGSLPIWRSGHRRFSRQAAPEDLRAPLRLPPAARSTVPLLPISPAVRSHSPTRRPRAAWRAIVPPSPISRSSGCGPNDEQVDSHQRVNSNAWSDGLGLAEVVPEQDAAGQVRAGHAVARIAEREQLMRKVPVRPDVRQAVRRARVVHAPAVRGLESRKCPDTGSRARTSAAPSAGRVAFSVRRSGRRSVSAPATSSRSSSSQRTRCGGSAESRTTVVRLPSCWRIFAGTGSVSAR